MMNQKTARLTQGAVIAAAYVVLTYVSAMMGLASGAIQLRLSEALTILPLFTPAAIPGLFVGCFLANLLTGCALWDVIFGSLATLLGAVGTYLLRKKTKWVAPIPPIVFNMLIVPPVLMYVYGVTDGWLYLCVTVGLGEIASCGILGLLFHSLIVKSGVFAGKNKQ